MGLKIWVVNMVLAGLAAFCAIRAYGVWSKEARHAPDAYPPRKPPAVTAKKPVGRETPPEAEYEIVAVKNLFSAERKEIEPEPEAVQEESAAGKDKKEKEEKADDFKADGKKMYLYGVVIAEDYQAALITNPNWKTDNKAQAWIRLGDMVQGFKVAAIETERVVLTSEGDEVEMFLYDKSKPRSAPKPAASAPTKASGKRVTVTGRKAAVPSSASSGKARASGKESVAPQTIQGSRKNSRFQSLQEKLKERGSPNAPKMPEGFGKFYSGKK